MPTTDLTVDPIFASIEAHRHAYAGLSAACKATDHRKKNTRAEEKLLNDAHLAEDTARWELGEVRPTTIAGVIALVHHANNGDICDDDKDRVLESVEAALAALFPAS